MGNTSQFSLANRKHFADLLADRPASLRQRARERFNERHKELYDRYFQESAERNGAFKIYDQITELKSKLVSLEAHLAELGFDLDYSGDLEVNSDNGGKLIDDVIEKRIEKEIGVSRDIDARFDSVAMAVMTVATLTEAQELLKSVQNSLSK